MLTARTHTARSGATPRILAILGVARHAVLGAALLAQGACYTYSPITSAGNLTEQRAEFRISDAGRVELQRELGPGALTVEGRIVAESDVAWNVKVYRLTNIEGHSMAWGGEEIVVPRTAVAFVNLRQFDRQKSLVAAAGVTGAVVVFVLTRNLFGGGFFGEPGPGPIGEAIRR